MASSVFLTARWQHLVLLNYEIDPSLLAPFVPKGTQLDLWNDKAYVSLVGFMFLDSCVRGISYPFDRNFEEVNLRFYIKKCDAPEGERRGVAFIREFVPRWGIALLARIVYNENYSALPMCHRIEQQPSQIAAEYQWKYKGIWQQIKVWCQGAPQYPLRGSLGEFITEHYWGYSRLRNGDTLEYNVQHPPWRIWEADQYRVDVDMQSLYGTPFAALLSKPTASVLLAEGSEVTVFKGKILTD